MTPLPAAARAVLTRTRGFMPDDEGAALYRHGRAAAARGPLLEIGTYCGRSALYLGCAAKEAGGVLVTVDHHRGSEENQPGWEHHDPAVVDPRTGRIDTLPFLRRTLLDADLAEHVVAVVGSSATVAAWWRTPVALLFVDGGHGAAAAHADYDLWARWVTPGGLLAIHDVFPDPADGGRPPYEIYLRARADGFADLETVGSLRVLSRDGISREGGP